MPGQLDLDARVGPRVGGHSERALRPGTEQPGVDFGAWAQRDAGTQLPLMRRCVPVERGGGLVAARRVAVRSEAEAGIRRVHAPVRRRRHVRGNLHAGRVRLQVVLEACGDQQVWWPRCRLDDRRLGLVRCQPRVMAAERRDVDRHPGAELDPIPRFSVQQLFGLVVGITQDTDQNGQRPGGNRRDVRPSGQIQSRRRPQRA